MSDAGLRSVEEAREAALAAIAGPVGLERLGVSDALGRVLASPIRAATALPPWDNSAMDGYAIRAADVASAREDAPVVLRVAGEVAAGGESGRPVAPGAAIRIATGAPLPEGADAVVPVELTTPLDTAGRPSGPRGRDATGPPPAACAVHAVMDAGANVRRRGSDLADGTVVATAGSRIGPALVALIAGSGTAEVEVRRRPRVAVLATGDEIRPAGSPLGAAGIPDANGPGLRALVTDAGATATDLGIAADRIDDVEPRLRDGIARADAVIVAGGVSVGPYDVVKRAFEAVGRVDLWRVAVQPGKPFAFGTAAAPDGRTVLLFGLPGNPVSGFVTFELFVRPAIRSLAGETAITRPVDRAVLLDRATKSQGRRAFLRVVAERDADGAPRRDGDGRVRVRLAGGQGSHVLSALAAADALAVIPEPLAAVEAGTPVELWWIDR